MVVSGLNLDAAELDLERPRVGVTRGGVRSRGVRVGEGEFCRPDVDAVDEPVEDVEEDRREEDEATLEEARDEEDDT